MHLPEKWLLLPTQRFNNAQVLASQLTNELRALFPNNAVEFFVSYYDYYLPEAFNSASDTYIDKVRKPVCILLQALPCLADVSRLPVAGRMMSPPTCIEYSKVAHGPCFASCR